MNMQASLSDYVGEGKVIGDASTSATSPLGASNADQSDISCPWDGCDRVFESERGVKVHHKKAHNVSIATPGPDVEVECAWCGETKMVYPNRAEQNENHFCCIEHKGKYLESRPKEEQYAWQGGKVSVECVYCESEKQVWPSRVDGRDYFFCDDGCKGEYISENNIGEDHPRWVSRIEVDCDWCDGSKEMTPARMAVSEHHFCSSECKGVWHSANFSGTDSPTWDGGWSWHSQIRTFVGPMGWRMARRKSREQYDGRCAIDVCEYEADEKSVAPDVHHIVPIRSGGVNAPSVLIPLCHSCHKVAEEYARSTIGNYLPSVYTDYDDDELPDGRLSSNLFGKFCTAVSSANVLKDSL